MATFANSKVDTRKDKKDRRRRSGKEPRREMGFNLEITRPNDKKTEKKFRFGEWEVLLEEGNTSWQKRCRRKGGGIGEQDRSDENAGRGEVAGEAGCKDKSVT